MVSRHGPGSRHKFGSGGQVDVSLLLDSVLRAVAIGVVVRVVEQRVDGLIPVQVNNAEALVFLDLVNPGITGVDHVAVDRSFGLQFAFD